MSGHHPWPPPSGGPVLVPVNVEDVRAIVGWWRAANEGPGGCSYAEAIKGMGPHVKALHDMVGEG